MTSHTPDRPRILAALGSTFGFSAFRPLQEEIITAILSGQDVFALMPTGGGKSLCYQLPALLSDRPTIVVSPLIALMKDQVDALQALGVPATFINSSLEPAEADRRLRAFRTGGYRLVYVAPERLLTDGFLALLRQVQPGCFAIDEAHCISEWGHDFRPEYRALKQLPDLFPGATIAAFTATATSRVQADIKRQLGLQRAASFKGSFNRANLYYDVRPKRDAYRQLVDFLRVRRQQSGIIYCQSRAGAESLASRLDHDGFSAAAYHAGLESDERQRRQEAFVRDRVRVIVATIAFGMGIDKPDVRFVVHYDLPKNLEGYYQESGRAGRDGDPADCLLFYSYGDVAKYQRFIAEKQSEAERRVAQQQLKQMADWAAGRTCRRRALLGYFEEPFAGQDGRCCDNCDGAAGAPTAPVDRTADATLFLDCVRRTGERFGATYLIELLRGTEVERAERLGHHKLAVYGSGRALSAESWRALVAELIYEGFVERSADMYSVITLTAKGREALAGKATVLLRAPAVRAPMHAEPRAGCTQAQTVATGGMRSRPQGPVNEGPASAQGNAELFERLRALRKLIADERQVPPYVIFHDAVLHRMVEDGPCTQAELLRIPGVGQYKVAEFGPRFLAAIAAHRRVE